MRLAPCPPVEPKPPSPRIDPGSTSTPTSPKSQLFGSAEDSTPIWGLIFSTNAKQVWTWLCALDPARPGGLAPPGAAAGFGHSLRGRADRLGALAQVVQVLLHPQEVWVRPV